MYLFRNTTTWTLVPLKVQRLDDDGKTVGGRDAVAMDTFDPVSVLAM